MPNGEVFDGRGEVFDDAGRAYYGRAYVHAVIRRPAREVQGAAQKPSRLTFLNATHFAVPFELVGRNVIVQLEDGRKLKAILEDTHGSLFVKAVMQAE